MQVHEIPTCKLKPAAWNSNVMDREMAERLRESINSFGLIQPLVVRLLEEDRYEVIGGSHRLEVLQGTGATTAPCVIVEADDPAARLLALALNNIDGEEDPGLQAESIRQILERYSESDVLSLLPETAESLQQLSGLGSISVDDYAESWQLRKKTRLKHFRFRVSDLQRSIVERAITLVPEEALSDEGNPNHRDNALVQICRDYIEHQTKIEMPIDARL